MSEKVGSDQFVGHPIVTFEESDGRRLPGRDLVDDFSDDDDITNNDDQILSTQKIEIVEDSSTPTKPPRKPSLLVDPSHKLQARKRSVTFEPIDVASLKLSSPEPQSEEEEDQKVIEDELDSADLECEKMDEELLFASSKSLSSPISIEQLRLRVTDQLPGSPPPRGSKRMNEARPPTPPGASHRVKYPKTPPPTPMDTKYI